MEKVNYQKELDSILENILLQNKITPVKKQTLLLHACCAPCSSYVIEYLSSFFDITLYYYNPNIFPPSEYNRRLLELENFLPRFPNAFENNVKLVKTFYNPEDYDNAVMIEKNPSLAIEGEKGERCRRCYLFRMKKAYEYASSNSFDWYTTTLSISPFKDSEKINLIGKSLEKENNTKFLTSDFKKKSGFLRSLELSKEYGLYRQQYCGCKYSYESAMAHAKKNALLEM